MGVAETSENWRSPRRERRGVLAIVSASLWGVSGVGMVVGWVVPSQDACAGTGEIGAGGSHITGWRRTRYIA